MPAILRIKDRRMQPFASTPDVRLPTTWTFVVLTIATWLAGCSVGPDYRTPDLSLPPRWTNAEHKDQPATTPELAQWWKRLGDPTLNALIDEAVSGNLDVATAKAKIRQARATYREAGGARLPSLDASGSATRSRSSASSSDGANIYNQFQAGFDASWELDIFGANRRSAEAARYGVQAAEENLRAVLLTLIGDIASNYVQARGYQVRMVLAERTAAAQRETAALMHVRFDAGTVSGLDFANATGQASATEASVATLKTNYTETMHRLGVLLGREPSALAVQLGGRAPIPMPQQPVPMGVPADILSSRPDVRQAERELAQATANIGVATAARYPNVTLGGNIATSGTSIGDLAKSTSVGWSFGPSINIPLFNGGQLAAAVDVAQAQRDQYFLALRSAVLNALEDVENAASALAQERGKQEKLAESASSYREAARLARSLYENGSSSFLDVLDAERSLYSAEDSLIQSRVAAATDYIALNKALGGGWDGAIDVPRPETVDTDTAQHFRSNHD